MKDDHSRFAVGHVIARAAERVDWDMVVPDAQGERRTEVSVLFESYQRGPDVQAIADENARLRDRLARLEARLNAMADSQ